MKINIAMMNITPSMMKINIAMMKINTLDVEAHPLNDEDEHREDEAHDSWDEAKAKMSSHPLKRLLSFSRVRLEARETQLRREIGKWGNGSLLGKGKE